MGQRPGDAQGAAPLSPRLRIGWLAVALIALLYLGTSAVVLINSFRNATGAAWLPSLPEGYYAFERALNLPFRPWFTLLRPLQERAEVSYASWALLSRGPLFAGALAALWLSLRALLRRGR